MNILVIGCGKVGSSLADLLSQMGHTVSIVDRNEENFQLLSSEFNGFTISGVPIDQDVLRSAGIEGCDAVAAVTPHDNVNIMVSQLATEIFKVPRVIARVYDPKREDVFQHFGLQTVCPTNLSVNAICDILTDRQDIKNLTYDASTVSFSTLEVPRQFQGKQVREIPADRDEVVFAVLHKNKSMSLVQLEPSLVLADGDRIIFARVID